MIKIWKTRRDGIKQRYLVKELRRKYKRLVKTQFPGENPRITNNYARFRQKNPDLFTEFRTKTISKDKKIILGRRSHKKKWEVQSIMVKIS